MPDIDFAVTSDELAKFAEKTPAISAVVQQLQTPLHRFQPRPDQPEEYDEQTAFLNSKYKCSILLGGTGCIAGETEVYDPVAEKFRRIDEIDENWHVFSMKGENFRFPTITKAEKPFVKGEASLYEIRLSNGMKFVATPEHKIYTMSGYYEPIQWAIESPHFDRILCPEIYVGKAKLDQPCHDVSVIATEFVRKGKFYDFTVPEMHNYMLAGCFHHNSGKTVAAAVKTAQYVLNTPPPRPRCPFWIVGETYELACGVCWDEKLSTLIPENLILEIDWYKSTRNWPFAVILRHPNNRNRPGWILDFKSYAQGRQRMQAFSIGGYWCNEEIPLPILQEVQGRCRDYDSPGWCDFTPVDLKSPEWIDVYEEPPRDWKFFHLNVELNDALPKGWADRFLETIPEDMRDTRRIGTFSHFSGAVYKEFNPRVHIINVANPTEQQADAMPWLDPFLPDFGIPWNWPRYRGVDWGYNNPFACLWLAKDRDNRFYIFDEHFEAQRLLEYHAQKIKEKPWDDKMSTVYKQTLADPSGAQERAQFAQLGIPTQGAYNQLLKGIEIVRQHLMVQGDGRPRLYVLSLREGGRWARCQNLIREIRSYHWRLSIGIGLRERNPIDEPVDKDNHTLDALRYVIATVSRGELPITGKILKKLRPWQEQSRRFVPKVN